MGLVNRSSIGLIVIAILVVALAIFFPLTMVAVASTWCILVGLVLRRMHLRLPERLPKKNAIDTAVVLNVPTLTVFIIAAVLQV